MTTPDFINHFKNLGIVIGAIAGAIGLFVTIKKGVRSWRDKHPPFRKTVIQSLADLKQGQKDFEDFNAAMLRERLESAHTIYAKEMGWCPSAEKRMLDHLFEFYEEKGWNHLNERYRKEISDLPESKGKRTEYLR